MFYNLPGRLVGNSTLGPGLRVPSEVISFNLGGAKVALAPGAAN